MKIMLIGGGSGGHITPLLAVARKIKQFRPNATLIAACEKGSKFTGLYEQSPEIEALYQISAGKYRRYAGQSRLQRLLDIETWLLNFRDVFRLAIGYFQASRLLRKQKPQVILIKGGFVAVPIGAAAALRGIPFITHDSDSSPGLANRIISRWAVKHATGMPTGLYDYPKQSTVHTGIPINESFYKVTETEKAKFKQELGLSSAKLIITVIGGSQGGRQLNEDVAEVVSQLMREIDDVGVLHIAGQANLSATKALYKKLIDKNHLHNIKIKGFVDDPATYTGAADIVVSRASATTIAELSAQAKAVVLVPGNLADSHQHKNADYLVANKAAMQVRSGDVTGLKASIMSLIADKDARRKLSSNLHSLAKLDAASELANLTINIAEQTDKTHED